MAKHETSPGALCRLALAAAFLSGCAEPTGISLHIDSQGAVPAILVPRDVDSLTVIAGMGGLEVAREEYPLAGPERVVAESLTLEAGAGVEGEIHIAVEGYRSLTLTAGGEVVTAFESGRVVNAFVHLAWKILQCLDLDEDGFGRGPGCIGTQDCDDSASGINPAAPEICNQVDDDCDGETDEDSCNPCTTDQDCATAHPCVEGEECRGGRCSGGTAKDCGYLAGECTYGACHPETGVCEEKPVADDTECDDGDLCTLPDACQGGACVPGDPKDCSHLDGPCARGVCAAVSGECEQQAFPEGDPCDDGDVCTLVDECHGGSCIPGDPPDCSGLDGPCVVGVCSQQSGECERQSVTEGTPCDDSDPCTLGDSCRSGVCGSTPRDCSYLDGPCSRGECDPASGDCEQQNLNEGQACDDQNACTLDNVCLGGTCTAGSQVDCSYLDAECVVGVCDQTDGSCEAQEVTAGTLCDDGDPCTTTDFCQFGICRAGQAKNCSHLNGPCQIGTCDAQTGDCEPVVFGDGAHCEEGNACTENDTCQAGSCVAGPPKDCSSLDEDCAEGVCDTQSGSCASQPLPEGSPCDDGLSCTEQDGCHAGVCSGSLIDGDDDGFAPPPCGTDCNDADGAVNPGRNEGPAQDPACLNTKDDDCDGRIDQEDASCWPLVCDPTGWCWESPRPQGNDLLDTWQTGSDDIWVVGRAGTVLHWDGSAWSMVPAGLTDIVAVAGIDRENVWILSRDAGGFNCWVEDGGAFVPLACGTGQNDLWMIGPDYGWTVGGGGKTWKWQSLAWTEVPTPLANETLYGVWGDLSNSWAVGSNRSILRWNGSAWVQEFSSVAGVDLLGVWGTNGAADIFAVGPTGSVIRKNGTNPWAIESSGTSQPLYDAWGYLSTDVWAVGPAGTVVHRTGSGWGPVDSGVSEDLNAVFGTWNQDLLAVGNAGTMIRWDGDSFERVDQGFPGDVEGLWRTSTGEIWAVGGAGEIQRRTTQGVWVRAESGTTRQLMGIWGFDPSDIWAVGDQGMVLRYDGTRWNSLPTGATTRLHAVWGCEDLGVRHVWAVGEQSTIRHWDGDGWLDEDTSYSDGDFIDYYSIWGTDYDNIWAVGLGHYYSIHEGGRAYFYNGSWHADNDYYWDPITDVWMDPVTYRQWLTTENGRLMMWDGSFWDYQCSGGPPVRDLFADSNGNIWVVGDQGSIMHWNGTSCEIVTPWVGSTIDLKAVTFSPVGEVWAAGTGGTILYKP